MCVYKCFIFIYGYIYPFSLDIRLYKAVIIMLYCWVYNKYRCNLYLLYSNITKDRRGKQSYIATPLLYFIRIKSILMWSRFGVVKVWNVILRKTTKKINEEMVKRSIKEFKVTLRMSLTQNKSAKE